ncbi:TPA: hypothetical protein ACHK6G_004866, partial [Escherichia coli]
FFEKTCFLKTRERKTKLAGVMSSTTIREFSLAVGSPAITSILCVRYSLGINLCLCSVDEMFDLSGGNNDVDSYN